MKCPRNTPFAKNLALKGFSFKGFIKLWKDYSSITSGDHRNVMNAIIKIKA